MIDRDVSSIEPEEHAMMRRLKKPYRKFVYVARSPRNNDAGNTARRRAFKYVEGDYILNLDDDDTMMVDNAFHTLGDFLEDMKRPDFVLFPCFRDGQIFFNTPAGKHQTVSCQYVYKPIINEKEMRWLDQENYDCDGDFLEYILDNSQHSLSLGCDPLTKVEHISQGKREAQTFTEFYNKQNHV